MSKLVLIALASIGWVSSSTILRGECKPAEVMWLMNDADLMVEDTKLKLPGGLSKIPKGSEIVAVREVQSWCFVKFMGVSGYVRSIELMSRLPTLTAVITADSSGKSATPTTRSDSSRQAQTASSIPVTKTEYYIVDGKTYERTVTRTEAAPVTVLQQQSTTGSQSYDPLVPVTIARVVEINGRSEIEYTTSMVPKSVAERR